jgi:hypothetical protein
MPTEYDINEVIRLRATFTDDANDPAAPQTPVQVTIKRPSGTIDGPFAMSSLSTGVYEYEYTASETGTHRWKAVTADNAIKQDSLYVQADSTD